MKTNPLGRTGIQVSPISFGTVELGVPYGVTSHSTETMLRPAQAVELLHYALDHGMNFFDTAPTYGEAEKLLGAAFHQRRDKAVIATKTTHQTFDESGKLFAPARFEEVVRETLAQSLANLRTDYVDVLLIHRVTDEVLTRPDVAGFFQQLKKEGLIRAAGISTYGPEQTRRVITSGQWDVVQLAFSMIDQTNASNLPLAAQHGVGVMVRSVLFRGFLTDNLPPLHPALKRLEEWLAKYRALVSAANPTLAQVATRFVLSHEGVSSALVGIDRMDYLNEALALAERPTLDAATLAQARELAFPEPEWLDLPGWDRKGYLKHN